MLTNNRQSLNEHIKAVAEVNGSSIYYELLGSGDVLVLIHGFTLDTRMWDDQFFIFSKSYRVLRYDMRGFGKSALPGAEIYSHHEDLFALLNHLNISKAHIIGLSSGGAVAVDFALTFPESVSSLILVDVSGLDGFMWPDKLSQWFSSIREAANKGNMSLARRLWLETEWFTHPNPKPEVLTKLQKIVADYSGWHFVNKNPIKKFELTANERLSEIKVPTLIILGEYDLSFYNHPLADRLAESIPNSRKVILTKVGHMSNMEAPQQFNEAVISFLAVELRNSNFLQETARQ